jgi:ribosomal RNA-processing protein 7
VAARVRPSLDGLIRRVASPLPPTAKDAFMPTDGSSSSYVQLPARVGSRAFLANLFARPHVSRAEDTELPQKRTLFIMNVPPGVGEGGLAAALSARGGEVSHVRLGGGGSSAHVVFAQASGLKKVLAATKPLELEMEAAATAGSSSATKSTAITRSARREQLQSEVSAFMERFEAEEARRQAEEEARHNQMDADGFVVVSRKRTGRSVSTDGSGATVSAASAGMERHFHGGDGDEGEGGAAGSGRRKKKKTKELLDFYHFQQHEKKREGLLKLRAQFEADRERIAKMRAERRFKPQGY